MPNLINKVVYGSQTLIDLTADTVASDKMLRGTTAHDKSGALITGTAEVTTVLLQGDDYRIILPEGLVTVS